MVEKTDWEWYRIATKRVGSLVDGRIGVKWKWTCSTANTISGNLASKPQLKPSNKEFAQKPPKLKRYNNRCQQFQQNKLFQNDQSCFYRSLEKTNAQNLSPNPEEATKFWSNLWRNPIEHCESTWLGEVKEDLDSLEKQENISIMEADFQRQIRRTASWKSPGPDGVHGFWYKNFYSLH